MAGFCSKCGGTLPSNTGFCPQCGTPAAVSAADPAYAPVAAPAAAPMVPPADATVYSAPPAAAAGYAATPASSGGSALKIILIIVVVIVGLGVLAAGVVGYGIWKMKQVVSRSVKVDDNGNATISAGGSTFSTGKGLSVSASDLGVDLYPGAMKGEGGLSMKLPTGSMVSAIYTTSDPVSAVVDFYKGKLGANEVVMQSGEGSVLSTGKNGKESITITVGPGTGAEDGKTKIVIMHTISTKD